MEESPKSDPAGSRKKPRTPPLPPVCIEQPRIDLGAFSPSFRSSGTAPSPTEKARVVVPTTRLGPHDSASAAAPVVKSSRGKNLCA
jgi:hypothetical protein